MEIIKVEVDNVNGILVTTSNRVAEELGVEHKNLLAKIDNYVEKFGGLSFSREFYIPSEYENRGKQYRNYLITEKGIAQLVGGYSSAVPKAFDLNVAYINEFERMKSQLSVPQTYIEALEKLLESEKEKERLRLENTQQKQQLIEYEPKVTYYDLVLKSPNLITITLIAKDYGKSGQWLNKFLKEQGIQYKQSGTWLLYQKYAQLGYTKSETYI